MTDFSPLLPEMSPEERAEWAIALIEEQIRALESGDLGRGYLLCPYCAGRNFLSEKNDKYCCAFFKRVAEAVLDRLEQEDRNAAIRRIQERAAEQHTEPLVTLD